MFNLFGDKKSRAKKKYLETLELAQKAQRAGDIKQYSFLIEKSEELRKEAGV